MTVREGCGYDIPLEASCYNPASSTSQPRVFINEARWVRGAVPFQGDVGSYRQYLINHEVGHAIGYQRHEPCGENGELAPVMMQQTFSTNNNDDAPGSTRNGSSPTARPAGSTPGRIRSPEPRPGTHGTRAAREALALIAVDRVYLL